MYKSPPIFLHCEQPLLYIARVLVRVAVVKKMHLIIRSLFQLWDIPLPAPPAWKLVADLSEKNGIPTGKKVGGGTDAPRLPPQAWQLSSVLDADDDSRKKIFRGLFNPSPFRQNLARHLGWCQMMPTQTQVRRKKGLKDLCRWPKWPKTKAFFFINFSFDLLHNVPCSLISQ